MTLLPLPPGGFAKNDVGFVDPSGVDHDRLGVGLKKAIYNFMHGVALSRTCAAGSTCRCPSRAWRGGFIEKSLSAADAGSS